MRTCSFTAGSSRQLFSMLLALLALGNFVAAVSSAADPDQKNQNWPQWRGPLCTGVAPDAHPPTEWSSDKNIKWKIELPGAGDSTPIIWNDQIFIHTASPTGRKLEPPADPPADPTADAAAAGKTTDNKDASAKSDAPKSDTTKSDTAKSDAPKSDTPKADNATGGKGPKGGKGMFAIQKPDEFHQFVLMSLDRKTGQEQWRAVAAEVVPHEGHHPDHGYASYSPVTDGSCVISYWGSRGLHCYDMQGHLKWEKDLGKMRTIFSFGEGSSPALCGNTVVVNWDNEDGSFIAAFNKDSGDELWRTDRDEKTTWATPLIVPAGDKMLVVTTGKQTARAYDLATGKEVWTCNGLTPAAIPTPVFAGGIVYLLSGFQGNSLLAIKADSSGDLTGTDAIVWKFDKDTPYVPSPLLYDNHLFCFKSNKAIISCFDAATGNHLFGPERLDGIQDAYASPVGADGHVYLVGRNGTTVVINNADKLDVIATNKLDEGIDASPAIVGNELFLRGKNHLYNISEK
ncbi:MAG TPA: PQQ-binding-like beta-propeller repeat protein [Pirellulales bacterium]